MITRVSVDYTHQGDHNLPTFEIAYRLKHSWHHDLRKDCFLFIALVFLKTKFYQFLLILEKWLLQNAATPALQTIWRLNWVSIRTLRQTTTMLTVLN